ncbi:MAG TPA: glycoside hydrolase family 47 protein [Kofleriaceae bacterium]|nr:glycoside hydrolase family 47 protein [Kofleriaceae bacterium]
MLRLVVTVLLIGGCSAHRATGLGAGLAPAAAIDRVALAAQVRDETRWAWQAYVAYAWGHDELRPVTRTARDWYGGSLLITPVDALDTLLMMGLTEEAGAARALIDRELSFDQDITVKNFEVTIRVLGGLVSGYQMTGDKKLLALADDLGTRLLPVFGSPTGMPYMYVNLRTGKVSGAKTNPAEIGTLVLEFGALAKLTGKSVYFDKAKRALTELFARRSPLGLVGEEIDVESGQWTSAASHVGGGIDSYYEYLLKGSILFDDAELARMWRDSATALDRHVADEVAGALWYGQVDMATGQRTASEFGALHAFLPAVLVLGGELDRARRLFASCFQMWQLRGIEPEGIDYRTMAITAPGYPLRPEIIESAWYLRRATQDPRYLAMGKTFLDALVAHTRTDAGYTVLTSVVTMEKGDLMPSYFLAETLKYLYLLFAPDEAIHLDRVVFTTEAHPIRRTW